MRLKDKRILVVDDEEVVRNAVRKALGQDEFQIDAVSSSEEALKLLAAGSYDLILADLMMPGIDGLELLERARALGVGAPAVMITGYPTVQTALSARRLGAFEYLTKPFTREELRSVVVRAIRSAEDDAARATPTPAECSEPVYVISGHTWARIERGGAVQIGMTWALARTVGEVQRVVLPGRNDELEQGRMFAVVYAADNVEHSLHCPVSGWVLEINQAVLRNPALAGQDPENLGWLLRVLPKNLEQEIFNLSPL